MMKKIIYIVLDGLGDRPHPNFGNKTPLEAAIIPHLNYLAENGQVGLVYTVGKNIAPESDVAVISILGYDAHKYYTGRGPLECFAEGLEVKEGDLAYRVNFATLGKNKEIIDRRVGRNLTTREASLLAREINEKVKLTDAEFIFKNTIGHRGVLLIKSKRGKLSHRVTNTDPAYGKEGVFGVAKEKFENFMEKCFPEDNSSEAKLSADLTNEFMEKSQKVLGESEVNKKRIKEGKLPANVILTRDAGDRLPSFPSLGEKFGVNFGCFVEMPVEKGIALLTGMEVIDLPSLTGDFEKDYSRRVKKALEAVKKYTGLYIHLKGPDEPAHDGNFLKKKEVIEAIDKFFFGNILPHIDLNNYIIAVTSDHSTPCILKAHSADPVPLLVCGGNIEKDSVKSFSEKQASLGKLKELEGKAVLPKLIEFAGS
ncbi:MAG: alkaline phosphatase family protein [Candidatus Omnitrophica bacterium]|nr:alkaline phosphatase family protein [Candidatus Omnitrophota bacterium]MCM8792919.1 alkaline phosphatase family protein [Candidatus Omnitrophota bacterium]